MGVHPHRSTAARIVTASRRHAAVGFITAWNPLAKALPPEENLVAQRELLAALQTLPECNILPAIGIGASGWREPSLFVIGADTASLDALGLRHRQIAYVHGCAAEPARLRLLLD
jgi:hypothetical protein